MTYSTRPYPLFSACGLNCGLCPRYYTDGKSRCPGCAGDGFSARHPACGVLSCCQRHGIAYCYQCAQYPCPRFDGADSWDSFITHKNMIADSAKAKAIGAKAYREALDAKVKILGRLLENYDDGRRKSFFCIAVNLLDIGDLARALAQIEQESMPGDAAKTRAALAVRVLQAAADKRGVSLRLRKKPKGP